MKYEKYILYKTAGGGESRFIKVSDDDSVQSFRECTGNRDLLISAWQTEIPDIASPRTYFIVFHITANNVESARVSTLEVMYYIEEKFCIPVENLIMILNGSDEIVVHAADRIGAAEIIILVPSDIFNGLPTPLMPILNYFLAHQMTDDGIQNIDVDVYQRNSFIPLINSINSKSNRFVISLNPKELLYLDGNRIIELSKQLRPDDVIIKPSVIPDAAEWFAQIHAEFEKKVLLQDELQKQLLDHGWEIPFCMRRWFRLSFNDNERLEVYRILSQYFSWIGASESEIQHLIENINKHTPIMNYQKLKNIITFGIENPWFVGCQHSLLQKFCPVRWFITEMMSQYKQPHLF